MSQLLQKQYENLIKKAKGRPSEHNIIYDEQYFKKYYLLTKVEIKCGCGAMVNNKSMSKHIKSKRHIKALDILQLLNV